MQEQHRIAIVCGAAAIAVGFVAVCFSIVVHQWNVTALVRVDPTDQIAPVALANDPGFAFTPNGHYDGVYAYAIALDPFARGEEHQLIDYAAYRYGRVAYGWAASVLTFGGRSAAAVPLALLVVNLASLAFAGYGASRLANLFGWSPWAGLLVAVTPGMVLGTILDTPEPFSAALFCGALLSWFGGSRGTATILMVALCLTREIFVAVPLGLLAWEMVSLQESEERWPKRVFLLAVPPVALALWWTYLRFTLDTWPSAQTWLIARPVIGWLDTVLMGSADAAAGGNEMQLGVGAIALVLTVGVGFVIAFVRALGLRNPLQAIFLFMVPIVSILSWYQTLYPKELFRVSAIPIMLLPAVIVGGSERWRPPRTEDVAF
jgi:hypothetical protein